MPRTIRALGLALVASASLVALACGGSGSATATPTPSATPTPTSTTVAGPPPVAATPTPTPQTYVVVTGDTLYDIAATFGVTVEALTAANGIDDPTLLQIGQVLVIPPPSLP